MDFLSYYGYLWSAAWWLWLVCALVFVTLGYVGAPFVLWSVAVLALLVGLQAPLWLMTCFVAVALIFIIPPLRALLVSSSIMKIMNALQLIPKISPTERTALEAGVVWMEAELFSGRPDMKKLLSQPYPKLTSEEQAFLDNEVEELCSMVDEWEVFKSKQLPPEVFEFIKKKGFLGMIIPKEYGGLGFSHSAHSAIIQKIASRSVSAVIYVMVPNSLGPAELLNHYGTEEQKKKYLPRLADGTEVPCFGLTEPTAGSDAGSITSEGILFKDSSGKICVRLNWKKRWITLAAISTILGIAFRLRDPENLLGRGEDLGITCALVPAHLPGVKLGRRHDPLGIPFHNCPMEGQGVVIDAEDSIIGGLAGAGKGWQMLMESLGAGRGISLPAQSAGGIKLVTRLTSNHATIRKQFGVSIGKFEGVEEPLARIAGSGYITEALRKYVLSALDQGISPPVCTAMAKYNATEMCRTALNDGMDVMGGAGISMGPRNLIATGYIGIPISITVEGANILTRTLMIFGQGALRAHPYAFKEVDAIEKGDLKAFDRAFWGHIGHIVRNMFRSLVLSGTRGYLAGSPVGGPVRRYYQKLAWTSASFAILADLAMGLLGGQLKIKEKITGRFADIMGWMFMTTAVLKRWEEEGRQKSDLVFVDYTMSTAFHKIQEAFDDIYANFDVPLLGVLFKGPILWWSRMNALSSKPSDRLSHKVADLMLNNQEVRERLTAGIYIPKSPEEALGRLERAYQVIKQAETVEKKIRKAIKTKQLPKKPVAMVLDEALGKGIVNKEEFSVMSEAERLRYDAIQVDDFSEEEYLPGGRKGAPASQGSQTMASQAVRPL